MNALKCDRCKRYYDINDTSSTEYLSCYKENRIDNSLKLFDLCPKCTLELEKWFEWFDEK